MTQDTKTPLPPAASGPTASGKRLLVQLMEYAFREGWCTPDDFLKHFAPGTIMNALKGATDLRVAILSTATGIYKEILRRKSPALAAEDLRIALEEGTTNSMQLLSVFSPEDRVRYLDAHQLWDFLSEDRFWLLDEDATDEQRRGAAARMTFTLAQALDQRLLSLRDVLDGLGYDAVADSLSPNELRSVVRHALLKGRDGIGLNEKVLLEVLPLDTLVASVSLEHIWHEVVIRRLAVPCGLTDLTREERRASQSGRRAPGSSPRRGGSAGAPPPPAVPRELRPASDHAVTAMPPSHSRRGGTLVGYPAAPSRPAPLAASSLLPPPPLPATGASGPPLGPPSVVADAPAAVHLAMTQPPLQSGGAPQPSGPPSSAFQQSQLQHLQAGAGQGSDAGESQRHRVTDHLRAIGRLPANHEQLSAQVLRSIDAMYALLPSATDDVQRKSVIRQAFANEASLRAALLGLIELMDSSVDTSDPVIQSAKIEALIKILLFEEQRRKETGRFPSGGSRSPSGVHPVAVFGGSGSYPPPGSRSSHPPPLPGQLVSSQPGGGTPPAYPPGAGGPPLPNLPAKPLPARRRTVPPPLPPSYQGGNS